jgi:hypothetical protein
MEQVLKQMSVRANYALLGPAVERMGFTLPTDRHTGVRFASVITLASENLTAAKAPGVFEAVKKHTTKGSANMSKTYRSYVEANVERTAVQHGGAQRTVATSGRSAVARAARDGLEKGAH